MGTLRGWSVILSVTAVVAGVWLALIWAATTVGGLHLPDWAMELYGGFGGTLAVVLGILASYRQDRRNWR